MLSLLPAPKHYFTSLSTVEKGTCKRRISATFLGTRTIFIRAVPKIFCRVNRPFSLDNAKTPKEKRAAYKTVQVQMQKKGKLIDVYAPGVYAKGFQRPSSYIEISTFHL